MSDAEKKSILLAALSTADSSREDRLTEILAVVLRQSSAFRARFLELFDLREPDDASWKVQTQRRFMSDPGEGGRQCFRPDLLFGSFESDFPESGEGLALEVKLNARLTLAELRRWPPMPDNDTEGPRPFRRGALIPFGYGSTACLDGTCEKEGCDCGGVLEESEREKKAFSCLTWSELSRELVSLQSLEGIGEAEKQYLYELECYMSHEPETNVSGDRGLSGGDLDRLPGARVQIAKANALFESVVQELEERGIRTPEQDGRARYEGVWSHAMENLDWARTMHLDALERVVIRWDGSTEGVELSEPVWWEVGLLADGSRLKNGNLSEGPTLILMLTWTHTAQDASGLLVEDLESGGEVVWSGPVKLGQRPRLFTSERLVDVLSLGSEPTNGSEALEDQARLIVAWIEHRIEDLTQREWISISR